MKFFFIIGNFFDVSGVIIADSQQDKKQKKLHIMNTVLSLFTAFTFALNGFAQGFSQSGDISDDMIPEDWEYLGSATGDLNNDGRADLFVVARPPEGGKPIAAVYWDLGDERWTLYKQYDNAFSDPAQMYYTPEYDIAIQDNGTLTIGLYDPEDFDMDILTSYSFLYKDGDFKPANSDTKQTFGEFEIN
jgi:hypothetical protein